MIFVNDERRQSALSNLASEFLEIDKRSFYLARYGEGCLLHSSIFNLLNLFSKNPFNLNDQFDLVTENGKKQ